MALYDKIESRNLQPYHIFMASFLAGLNEMGMLNQASVNVASRRAGRYLAEYAKAKHDLPSTSGDAKADAKSFVDYLNRVVGLGTEVDVTEEEGGLRMRIVSSSCSFCPKGVGEAELQGTLCPYPGLIEEFVNNLLTGDVTLRLVTKDRRPMVKKEDGCYIQLS